MDVWSEIQLKKMFAGGNANCRAFFDECGVPHDAQFSVKYDTQIAELYKQKLTALAKGESWNPPATLPRFKNHADYAQRKAYSVKPASQKASKDNDDWEDWLNEPKKKSSSKSHHGSSRKKAHHSSREKSHEQYTQQPYVRDYKGDNEDLRRMQHRTGFGSSDLFEHDQATQNRAKPEQGWGVDAVIDPEALNKSVEWVGGGLGTLSSYAASYASTAAVISTDLAKTGYEKTVQYSGQLAERDWSKDAEVAKQSLFETTTTGWGLLSGAWENAKKGLETLITEEPEEQQHQQPQQPQQQSQQQSQQRLQPPQQQERTMQPFELSKKSDDVKPNDMLISFGNESTREEPNRSRSPSPPPGSVMSLSKKPLMPQQEQSVSQAPKAATTGWDDVWSSGDDDEDGTSDSGSDSGGNPLVSKVTDDPAASEGWDF
eukprot:TRINITY_DN6870_c0_g1_i1.p1 TRINITY_DN6870_c0_g1~~TRINITY_DN6870_c0_g1_i1.p1  ORF type:complete len:494 (+),score=92.15 TRINITY_DN6870_c0_g1_i1:194-1483(+)